MILGGVYRLLDPLLRFQEVAVLCYHRYDQNLESHLRALKARGYVFVPLADVVAWASGGKEIPRKCVSITFDDGYPDFGSSLTVLKRYNAPVTLFATSGFDAVGLRGDQMVEIAYHSKTHQNLSKLNGEDLVREIEPPAGEHYFAYPGGNHSPAARATVRAAGYEAAFGIRPVLVKKGMDPYLLPRIVILKTMSAADVLLRASRAADWYYALKKIVQA